MKSRFGIFVIIAVLLTPLPAIATVGLSVTPGNWDVGTVPEDSVLSTWTATTPALGGYFTVTHTGTDQWESISIRCDNTTDWSVGTVRGHDQFTLGWGLTVTQGEKPSFTALKTTDKVMIESLTQGSNFSFDLELGIPVPSSTQNEQNIIITLTASTPVGYVYCLSGDFWARNIGGAYWTAEWSSDYTHMIIEAEWGYMVADGLFGLGNQGWTPDEYNSTNAYYFRVTSVTPQEVWHFATSGKTLVLDRWVVLD